jgi:SAM-dependent methyltransferase
MPDLLHVNPDAIFRMHEGLWLLSNPRLRTHVEFSANAGAAFAAMSRLSEGADLNLWSESLKVCSGFDRTERFFGSHGLHTDHSGLTSRAGAECFGTDLVELLRQRLFLIASREQSLEVLKPLSNIFDRAHLGSFHQRVGQYLVLEKRAREPWRDWHDQKFSSDGLSLRPGPYRDLQEKFFDQYFSKHTRSGKAVLDFGCGNGYYSNKFANLGMAVLALDSSSELLEVARANYGHSSNVTFGHVPTLRKSVEYLNRLPAQSLDFIYLQDTLLLLLEPEHGSQDPAIEDLLHAFRRLLAPRGRLMSMEPNAVFWLCGRYGDPQSPYAIVTEYRHHVFNVAPTLDRILPHLSRAGMGLVEYEHPSPRPGSPDGEFAREFPIWDFLVFGAVA